ncbi:MAG: DNA polymerase III subunit delta' [Gammaproteobacteria bacterium]|nr:DNA polymerase III subunit delta' [Gammaproteobacteria bacterium]
MIKPFPWQIKQWDHLQSAYAQNRLPHALLLAGPAGIGLQQFSFSFAAALLCIESRGDGHACGICKSCHLLQAGTHPDLLSIQPEETGKQIKVDMVRELVGFIQNKSQFGNYKLAIIDPAEAMNRSAANGLLKTLEEPPADSVLILLTEKSALLPITIRSRCQKIDFPVSNQKDSLDWLQGRLGADADAAQLLSLAQGAPLKAIEIQESDQLEQQLELLRDLKSLREQRCDVVKLAEKWLAWDALLVFMHLLNFFNMMSRIKLGIDSDNSSVHKHLQGILKGLDLVQLIRCYDLLLRHYNAVRGPTSLNKQGLLEDFIIYWQKLAGQNRG